MEQEVKNYEICYVIHPDVSEEDVFGYAGKITGAIQDLGGVVGRIGEPKRERLAYPVRKQRVGYIGYTAFSLAPKRLRELEQRVRAESSVLRFLIVGEVDRPSMEFRPRRPRREPSLVAFGEPISGFTPQAPIAEDQSRIEELDKQLDEALGKANPPA